VSVSLAKVRAIPFGSQVRVTLIGPDHRLANRVDPQSVGMSFDGLYHEGYLAYLPGHTDFDDGYMLRIQKSTSSAYWLFHDWLIESIEVVQEQREEN
jgi:hypothetical protein